jgi:membrane associated rhomboid family serine protease
MTLLVALAAFVLPLVLHAPQSESLRDAMRPELAQRLRSRIGTLSLGFLLIGFAAFTFRGNALSIEPRFAEILALSRYGIFEKGWVFQLLTNGFVHINFFHLASNLLVLMLLSAYEWRVGVRRYLAVFLVGTVGSSVIDLAFMPADTLSMGASAGICALAAAYFLDHEDISRKDWAIGVLFVLALVGAYSFVGVHDSDLDGGAVNWTAHMSGAALGAIYVRMLRDRRVKALPAVDSWERRTR